jgi:hypothetical protein
LQAAHFFTSAFERQLIFRQWKFSHFLNFQLATCKSDDTSCSTSRNVSVNCQPSENKQQSAITLQAFLVTRRLSGHNC